MVETSALLIGVNSHQVTSNIINSDNYGAAPDNQGAASVLHALKIDTVINFNYRLSHFPEFFHYFQYCPTF